MKRFACGDIVPGCTAAWQAEDEEALLRDVSGHAAEAHGLAHLSPSLVAAVRQRTFESA